MRYAPIPILAAPLLLAACNVSTVAGVRIDPPPASIAAPCGHPREHLGAGDWELIAGRIGDELIDCRARHAALAEWSAGVIKVQGR